jgi:hypothetical protein
MPGSEAKHLTSAASCQLQACARNWPVIDQQKGQPLRPGFLPPFGCRRMRPGLS